MSTADRRFGNGLWWRVQGSAFGKDPSCASAWHAWLATAGGSGCVASAMATRAPGQTRDGTLHIGLYPRHTTARGLFGRNASWSLAPRAQRRYRGRSSDLPEEQVSAGSEIPATSSRRCRQRGLAPRTAEGPASAGSSARDDNGKRARAAVMRYGCRRGVCFEGYEPRCGERRQVARPLGAWLSGHEASV
jgi:hypothetical protein